MKLLKLLKLTLIFCLFFFSSQIANAQNSTGIRHEIFNLKLSAGVEKRIDVPFLFQAFAIGEVEGLEVSFFQGKSWSEWTALRREEPEFAPSEILFIKPAHAFLVRSEFDRHLKATVMQLREEVLTVVQNDRVVLDAGGSESSFRIISRDEWGANEKLGVYYPQQDDSDDGNNGEEKDDVNICAPLERAYPNQYEVSGKMVSFDDLGRPLIWPRQYSSKIKKIVIHHTAQSLKDLNGDNRVDARDYKLGVQAIYTYHTLSRGWGDIGYHYLVDPLGNVYEGRAGGPDVIGAHVLCQNSNTIGISVMGNFEEVELSEKGFAGLVNITYKLASDYDINPLGKSSFRGKVLPHIVTHAEVGALTKQYIGQGATQCPGDNLISAMDRLRVVVAEGGIRPAYAYEVDNVPRNLKVNPLQTFDLKVRLKNSGYQPWNNLRVYSRGKKDPLLTLNTYISTNQIVELVIPYQAELDFGSKNDVLSFEANSTKLKKTLKVSYRVNKPSFRYDLIAIEGTQTPVLVGEKRMVKFSLKNTGNFPWLPTGKNSLQLKEISRDGDLTSSVPGGMQVFLPQAVLPGTSVSLNIEIPPRTSEGSFKTEFLPMIGRDKGLKGKDLKVNLSVELPKFAVELAKAEKKLFLKNGYDQEVQFQLVNKGNFDWETAAIWYQLKNGDKKFIDKIVKQGDSYMFTVNLRPGYDDKSVMLKGNIGIDRLPAFIEMKNFKASKVAFSEEIKTRGSVRLLAELVDPGTLPQAAGVHEIRVQLKNTGNVPWYQDGPEKTVLKVKDKADFYHKSWERRTVAGFLDKPMVLPNEIGTFVMSMEVRIMPKRTTYDEFVAVAAGKELRLKGKIRLGVEVKGTKSLDRSSPKSLDRSSQMAVRSNAEFFSKDCVSSSADCQLPTANSTPPMRVWLTGIDQSELQISSPGNFVVWDSKTVQIRSMSGGEIFTARSADVQDGTILRIKAKDEPYLELKNWGAAKTFGTQKYFDNKFRNVIELRFDDGKMIVINELNLEDYMKGIAEVPESDDQPQEKRKTIAVLSRSYALHYLISGYEKFPGKPYNGADSPAIFQKYLGYGFEERSPKWQLSLEETEGEVVLVSGSQLAIGPEGSGPERAVGSSQLNPKELVLRAAYFSCTDGDRTKSPAEAGWGGNEYFQKFGFVFQSVEDPLGDDPTRSGMSACGHQVGLSGYGATQMAKAGKNYREIIGHYYQEVDVRQAQSP